MYEIIKNVINKKDYKLEDILYKINKMWIENVITEEEKTELDSLARQNANSESSYAPLQKQIDKLYEYITEYVKWMVVYGPQMYIQKLGNL